MKSISIVFFGLLLLSGCLGVNELPNGTTHVEPGRTGPFSIQPLDSKQFLLGASDSERPSWQADVESIHLVPGGRMGLIGVSSSGAVLDSLDHKLIGISDYHSSVSLPDGTKNLSIGYDFRERTIFAFQFTEGRIEQLPGFSIQPTAFVADICIYTSPESRKTYVFTITSDGFLSQWELLWSEGTLRPYHSRTVPIGVGASKCDVVDEKRSLFFLDAQSVVWKIGAEPEQSPTRSLFWTPHHPSNQTGLPKKGKLLDLIAENAGDNVEIYLMFQSETEWLVARSLRDSISGKSVKPPKIYSMGLPSRPFSFSSSRVSGSQGVSLLATHSASDSSGLAATLFTVDSEAPHPATTNVAAKNRAFVEPLAETEPVKSFGDAADDPAIWTNYASPADSVIFGSDKQSGIYGYDLTGKMLLHIPDGRINNIDIRYDFSRDGTEFDILLGSNRSTRSISSYAISSTPFSIRSVENNSSDLGLIDPYGICLYKSPETNRLYAFVTDSIKHGIKQILLSPTASGTIDMTMVRSIPLSSKAEGCVADDHNKFLFVNEEDVGLWRLGAEPTDGDTKYLVDSISGGQLTADIEGISIYADGLENGYLVLSSQGSDDYAVYDRNIPHGYVGRFSVGSNPEKGIDGTSETDGLAIESFNFGSEFDSGLMVVQDNRNIGPLENQNFKYVPWKDIEAVIRSYRNLNP